MRKAVKVFPCKVTHYREQETTIEVLAKEYVAINPNLGYELSWNDGVETGATNYAAGGLSNMPAKNIAGIECKTRVINVPNYYSGVSDPSITVGSFDDMKTAIEMLEARIARLEAALRSHVNRGLPDGVEVVP